MLVLLNKARKDAGAAPLSFSQELEDEAQQQADELAGTTVPSASWTQHHTRSLLMKHAGVQLRAVLGCAAPRLPSGNCTWALAQRAC